MCENILLHARLTGLRQRRTLREKIDDFRAAFWAYDSKPPTHTPHMSRALRSGIPSLSCPVPKSGLMEKNFSIVVQKCQKKWVKFKGQFLKNGKIFRNAYHRIENYG